MAIAIAIKPIPGPMDKPGISPDAEGPDDGGEMGASDAGMAIVDACKQLDPADVQTLVHGISPEAIEVMEQIPDLKPFANYIEHGDTDEESPEAPPGNTGPSKMTALDSVAHAMGQVGIKSGY